MRCEKNISGCKGELFFAEKTKNNYGINNLTNGLEIKLERVS